MLSFAKVRNLVGALAMASALLVGGAAHASDCHTPRCYWKTVTVYVSVTKPCTHYIVEYDHCGKAFIAKQITYKTVQVPVEKKVRVCY